MDTREQLWWKSREVTPEKRVLAQRVLEEIKDGRDVFAAIRRNPLPGGEGFLSKGILIAVYRDLVDQGQWEPNPTFLEKIRLKIEMLPRYTTLKFYSAIGVLTILGISLIILSSGYAGAKIKKASVCIARVGEHSEIPVHYKDLQHFYPIAVNLSLAEIQASTSTSHEQAYQISRQMVEDITSYTRAIAGKRGLLASDSPFANAYAQLSYSLYPNRVSSAITSVLQ